MRPASRTLPEVIDHLEQQRRLAARAIDATEIRLNAIDRVLERVRSGDPIHACGMEDLSPEDWSAKW